MGVLFVWRSWSFLFFWDLFFFTDVAVRCCKLSDLRTVFYRSHCLVTLREGEKENPQSCEKPEWEINGNLLHH